MLNFDMGRDFPDGTGITPLMLCCRVDPGADGVDEQAALTLMQRILSGDGRQEIDKMAECGAFALGMAAEQVGISTSSPHHLRISPHISPYLPTSPHLDPHISPQLRLLTYLPTSPHTSLRIGAGSPKIPQPTHLRISPHISPYLPTSIPISPHNSASSHISPHLPTPPCASEQGHLRYLNLLISPYLPISPHISPQGHLRYLNLLIEARAEVNAKDHLGRTALAYAVMSGFNDVAHALMAADADASIRRMKHKKDKKTPYAQHRTSNPTLCYCAPLKHQPTGFATARL